MSLALVRPDGEGCVSGWFVRNDHVPVLFAASAHRVTDIRFVESIERG
jgi:hypothetical protein